MLQPHFIKGCERFEADDSFSDLLFSDGSYNKTLD